VIFGGAFDPPHRGHIDCLNEAAKRFPDAKFLITPSFAPPVSSTRQKDCDLNFEQRVQLCRASFSQRNLENIHFEISLIEQNLPRPNFTLRTLQALTDQLPQKKFALLMGQDQLASFSTWYQPKDILDRASLLVVNRSKDLMTVSLEQILANQKGAVLKMLKALGIATVEWDERAQAFEIPDLQQRIYLIPCRICPATSTEIRELRKSPDSAAQEQLKQWLDHETLAIIHSKDFYI